MKLLGSGYEVTETTFAGSTAGGGGAAGAGTYGPGFGFNIRKVIAFTGGSSVAANSSGGIQLTIGDSSGAPASTFVVLPYPRFGDPSSATGSAPMVMVIDDLDLKCNWFEARCNEAAAGGWGIYVLGE